MVKTSIEEFSIPLWKEGLVPGKTDDCPEQSERLEGENPGLRVTFNSRPSIAVYKVSPRSSLSPGIIVCPGGGYGILAYEKEGTEITQWLNSMGITAVVLKYRVPNNREGAFADIQRAMRFCRAHSKEWEVDANQWGVIGFSAGGHLCARLSSQFHLDAYPKLDRIDEESSRPDFAILVYPADLEESARPDSNLSVTRETSPTLLIHTKDDQDYISGSEIYASELKKMKVSHHFFLYQNGGHGYGLRSTQDVQSWPMDCMKWLSEKGISIAVPNESIFGSKF